MLQRGMGTGQQVETGHGPLNHGQITLMHLISRDIEEYILNDQANSLQQIQLQQRANSLKGAARHPNEIPSTWKSRGRLSHYRDIFTVFSS